MSLLADDRAQSIQVGAVLLFAVLILAFSTYQAVIVPEENRRVEFEHNQEVQSQLSELRDAISATQDGGATRSTTVDLGTQYPSRALGLNPSPPSGTLRTVGTSDPLANLTVRNATATGETGDFWNSDPRHYDTGGLAYAPRYHRYSEAPETTYEHTVLANDFGEETLVVANQSFIEGTTVSFVAMNGSLQRTSSGATSVDTRPISSSDRSVLVEAPDATSPVTLNFTSRHSGDRWWQILSDQDHVVAVDEFPSAAGDEFNAIRVTLDHEETYELQLTKAAVGTGATDEEPAYLTDVAGDESTVARGNSQELTVEVRDAYNNPVAGVPVEAAVASAVSLDDDQATTGSDGRATFTFRTTVGTPAETHDVNVTFDESVDPASEDFDRRAPDNASMSVTVTDAEGGGAGAYDLNWTNPDLEEENDGPTLSPCTEESCTWDVGASDGDALALNASLKPPFQGIDLEFAVDDRDIATVSPVENATESNGAFQPTLAAVSNGTVNVLASASDDSDVIEIQVENVSGSGGGGGGLPNPQNGIRYDGNLGTTTSDSGVQFDITNVDTSFARIEGVRVEGQSGNTDYIFNDQGREIEIVGGQPDGFADDRNSGQDAYPADGSYIDFVSTAVLTTSGSSQSATVLARDFGSKPSPSASNFNEYDFSGLQRVANSDPWDVSMTLVFQNRGDVTFYFQEV